MRAALVLTRFPWPTCLKVPTKSYGTRPSTGPREPVLPCSAVPWGQVQTGTGTPCFAAGIACVQDKRRQSLGAAQGQGHTGQCWQHTGLLAHTAAQGTPEKKQKPRERKGDQGEAVCHVCAHMRERKERVFTILLGTGSSLSLQKLPLLQLRGHLNRAVIT